MGARLRLFAVAFASLGISVQTSAAAEAKTWYVYCEGASAGDHWAVFSENLWPHPETANYGDRVGSIAKAFFERRHALSLEGCAGVNFRDDSLAEHSRQTTAQLHRRMGDRVYFFTLPNDVLREDPEPEARVVLEAAAAGGDAATIAAPPAGSEASQWRPAQWRPATSPR